MYKTTFSQLAIPAGCYLFWDSAMIHANRGPANSKIKHRLRRLVLYLAMQPIDNLPVSFRDTWIRQRRQVAAEGITSTHWIWDLESQKNTGRFKMKRPERKLPASCRKTTFTADEWRLLTGGLAVQPEDAKLIVPSYSASSSDDLRPVQVISSAIDSKPRRLDEFELAG